MRLFHGGVPSLPAQKTLDRPTTARNAGGAGEAQDPRPASAAAGRRSHSSGSRRCRSSWSPKPGLVPEPDGAARRCRTARRPCVQPGQPPGVVDRGAAAVVVEVHVRVPVTEQILQAPKPTSRALERHRRLPNRPFPSWRRTYPHEAVATIGSGRRLRRSVRTSATPWRCNRSSTGSMNHDGWRNSTARRRALGHTSSTPASSPSSARNVGGSCKSAGPNRSPSPVACRMNRCTGSAGSRSRFTWLRYLLTLGGEVEAIGNGARPGGELLTGRQSVEGVVDLDGREPLGVVRQPRPPGHARRVDGPGPVVVHPPRRPDLPHGASLPARRADHRV